MTKINELARADIVADNDLVPIWDTLNKDTRAATVEAIRSGGLRSELAASSGSGLVGHVAAGAGAVARTVRDKLRDVVSVKDFGAVGDGATDDTEAIQAAINAAGGGVLHMEPGATYRITSSPVVSTSGLTIEGNGATLNGSAIAAATALDQVYGLRIEGSIGSTVAMTADAAEGAVALTVSSTAGLAAGDLLLVYSTTEKFPEGATGATNFKGALHRIRSVDSGTALTLMDGLLFNLTAASGATIRKVTPVSNVHVHGLRVVMGGLNKAHCGVRIKYAVDCWLHDCETRDTEDTGVRFDHAFGGGARGGDYSYANSPADGTSGVAGVTGYGVCAATATRSVTIDGASFRGCRHAVAGGGTYPSFFTTAKGCTVDGNRSAAYSASYALDCHEDCFGWVFDGNTINGSNTTTGTAGILIRGQRARVTNNTVTASQGAGILLQNYDNPSFSRGAVISGNVITASRLDGILVNGSATMPWYDVVISNNIITDVLGEGISLWGLNGGRVSGNQIRISSAATNKSGVRLVGTAATLGNCVQDVEVCGNIVQGSTMLHGLRADFAQGCTFTGNQVLGSVSECVSLTNCTGGAVTGGKLRTSGATRSGVYLNACVRVAVSGVEARNTGTASGASSGVYILGASTDVSVVGGVYSAFINGVLSASPANFISVAGINARTCTTSVNIAASANTAVAANL